MQTQFRLAFILAALGAATAPAAAWNPVARPASEAPFTTAPLKPILIQDAEPQPGAEQPDGEGAQSDEGGMESGADADEEYWAFPKDFKFDRIPVTFPASAEAPGLTDFLATLRGISEKRDDAALVATIAPKIFWDRDFGGGFDEALSGVENFRNALQIGVPDLLPEYADDGWKRLSLLLVSGRFSTEQDHPDTWCTPVFPALTDAAAAEPTFKKLDMGDGDWQMQWGYIDGKTEAREKPSPDAAVVGQVENEALPVYSWSADDSADWVDVGLPDGRRAFVDTRLVGSWVNERLCVGKQGDAWKIVGYMGGGD